MRKGYYNHGGGQSGSQDGSRQQSGTSGAGTGAINIWAQDLTVNTSRTYI